MTVLEGWGEDGGSVGEEDWVARALCLFPRYESCRKMRGGGVFF
jgi:hypothetical protein